MKYEFEKTDDRKIKKMTTEERIDRYFNTSWCLEDFIQAYLWSHDIDLECLEDQEFRTGIEEAVEKKLSPEVLDQLQEAVMADINERIAMIF